MVVYHGRGTWPGPKTLHEMMEVDERLNPFVADFKMPVLEILQIPEKDAEQVETNLSMALLFFLNQDKPERVTQLMEEGSMKKVSNEAIAFVNRHAGTEFEGNSEGGLVDMCEAIEKMLIQICG